MIGSHVNYSKYIYDRRSTYTSAPIPIIWRRHCLPFELAKRNGKRTTIHDQTNSSAKASLELSIINTSLPDSSTVIIQLLATDKEGTFRGD